jgi:hypothetical protein
MGSLKIKLWRSLFLGPFPVDQIAAPGNSNGGIFIKISLCFSQGTEAMKEHQVFGLIL